MKVYFVIFFIFHVLPVCSYSKQDVTSEKLYQEEIYQQLIATEDVRTQDFNKFSQNLLLLIKERKKFSKDNQCYFDYLSAYQSSFLGKFKLAIDELHQLFNKCKDLKIKVRVKALLANLYAISGDYQKAILNLDFIISNIDNIKDPTTKYFAYIPAFIVYDIVDQADLSLKFAELLINERPPEKYLCKGLLFKYKALFGTSYQNDLDSDIQSAIKLCKQAGEIIYSQAINLAWLNSRFEFVKERDGYLDLLKILLKSSDIIEKTNYKSLISVKNGMFAEIYEKLGNSKKAYYYAKLTIKDSVSIGETEQKIKALQVLINYHQKEKDFKSTNKLLIEKNKAEKKLYSDTQAKLMAYQTVKHDSLAKTLQIESLNQKNKLLELEKELTQKSKTNQRLLNVLFAAFILFLFYMGFRIKRKQQQYKKLSELDHMTLIYNRKGIRDYMDYLLPYAQNKNEVVAYGIFDLDLFKTINDKYGHNTGDWVIKAVVDSCKKLDNNKVTFARLGGEEFAIIIRDSSLNEMIHFSEQCRQAITAIVTEEGTGFVFEISASFGITTTELSGFDYSDLMQNADKALYAAKNKGRNQVSIYQQT